MYHRDKQKTGIMAWKFILMSLAFISLSLAIFGNWKDCFYVKMKTHGLGLGDWIIFKYESVLIGPPIMGNYMTINYDKGDGRTWLKLVDLGNAMLAKEGKETHNRNKFIALGIYGQVIHYGTIISIVFLAFSIIAMGSRLIWPLCVDKIRNKVHNWLKGWTYFVPVCVMIIKFLTIACTMLICWTPFCVRTYKVGIYFWVDWLVLCWCYVCTYNLKDTNEDADDDHKVPFVRLDDGN
eukprot:257312_1